jgi:hypothetical protein
MRNFYGREEAIRLFENAFGNTYEDRSLMFSSKHYDGPIFFGFMEHGIEVVVEGLSFDIPYHELEGIAKYPHIIYINAKTAYKIWK